ncbi:MAG: helix-turn-helix domain-containing protein [Oscillospiraceae bacterium]|jgi:transcriptional regulator with XRE-family HTH domain|nr:helix-turn-helix domain-containing protein [Oscillospiraceae bacterium]
MTIGERVHFLINANKNLSASGLARHLKTKSSTISGWKEKNRNPSSDLIIPICEYLGCSAYFLLTGKEQSPARVQSLTEEEQQILSYYQEFDEDDRTIIKAKMIELLREQRKRATEFGIDIAT